MPGKELALMTAEKWGRPRLAVAILTAFAALAALATIEALQAARAARIYTPRRKRG